MDHVQRDKEYEGPYVWLMDKRGGFGMAFKETSHPHIVATPYGYANFGSVSYVQIPIYRLRSSKVSQAVLKRHF